MGGREPDTKVPKASAVQEQSPSKITCSGAAAYPDWSGFQAYSPMFPHGFFHSPMASSAQTHPFMWGAQHFMPPYGTPASPYVMYPHGVYAHPSVQTCSVPSSTEADAKSSVSKEKNRPQKSKERSGSLNIFTGNENNLDKHQEHLMESSHKEYVAPSGDNGSEDSTEGSGANFRNDLEAKMGDRQESLDETSQNDTGGTTIAPTRSTSYHTMPMMPMPAAAAPGVVARPTTNLNIGMEYWVSSTSSAIPPINGKVPATVSAGTVVPGALVGANEKVPPEIWLQDERELKRQRRKQSNRESARRSRLRKQAEYEELAQCVEVLKEENTALRAEVERIKKEFNELLAQNASLQERIEEETIEEGSIIEKSSLLAESGAARTVNSDS